MITPTSPSTPIRIALDWTPNTLHSGLLLAHEKGFYAAENLSITFLNPATTEYTLTPAKQLEAGHADLVICPSESCIAYNETGKMRLQALYAICGRDASAVVTVKRGDGEKGYDTLAELDTRGGVYGSYNAKYEDDIVRAMVASSTFSSTTSIADTTTSPPKRLQTTSSHGKLTLFDSVLAGTVDATWIFLPWEGIEAELAGVTLNIFQPGDYGVPYGYSPVIARDASSTGLSADVLKAFVRATRQGYEFAMDNPEEAARIVGAHCEPKRSTEFMEKSQRAINKFYTEEGKMAGGMQEQRWGEWVQWLRKRGLLKGEIKLEDLYTSEFTD